MIPLTDNEPDRKYTDGQVIEYTSFDPSGYSTAQFIRYAPADEQTRACPNCGRRVVPHLGGRVVADDAGLFQCPVCLALCQFPALEPVVYIRPQSGSKPFTVREGQLRLPGPRYTAHITPQAWQRDQAIEVDAPGPQEWECTRFARGHASYLQHLARDQGPIGEVIDNDDLFKLDPAAPSWVRAWTGPFTITIRQETHHER